MAIQNRLAPVSCVLSIANLAVSGAGNTNYTAAAFNFVIDGIIRNKGATAATAVPNEDAVTGEAFRKIPSGHHSYFYFQVDKGGVIRVSQGDVKELDLWQHPDQPPLHKTSVVFGRLLVKNAASGADWIFGVNNWNQAGISTQIENLMTLPSRRITE